MKRLRYIAIDPGLTKCGYVVMTATRERLALEIVPAALLIERMSADLGPDLACVCVGNATRSEAVVASIRERWPNVPIAIVDERNTSLEARRRYYEDHPPKGLLRLVPRGLLVPKEPLDGYAALLILERYLNNEDSAAAGRPARGEGVETRRNQVVDLPD